MSTSPKTNLENLFPLPEAAHYFRTRGGKTISLPTLYRWSLRGVRGVRLKTIKVGLRAYTCDEWLNEFVAALNADRPLVLDDIRPSDRELARRAAVNAELNQAGI